VIAGSGGRCRSCFEKLSHTPEGREKRAAVALLVRCPVCFRDPGQPCIVITRHPFNATPAGDAAPRPHWKRVQLGFNVGGSSQDEGVVALTGAPILRRESEPTSSEEPRERCPRCGGPMVGGICANTTPPASEEPGDG